MKSFFKNKKNLMNICVLVLVFSIAGTSAWFVSQIDAGLNDAIMGNLGIKANFDADEEDVYLEPGLSVTKTANFKNTGTIALCAKLNLDTEVTVYRDAAGEPLGDPAGMPAPAGDNYVDVVTDLVNLEAEGVIQDGDNYYIFAWLYDKNNPEDLYLFADPTVAVKMDFNVDISGATPNQYMDAKVSFAKSIEATQLNSDAILDELGIDVADLGYVSELQINGFRSFSSNPQHQLVKAWVEEQLSR